MKCLVTGGDGFIGSKIVEKLNCEAYDLKSGKDILDKSKLKVALKDIDVIFHTAAKISVPESQDQPSSYQKVNVEGTKNIVDLSDAKIIFSSSAAVYGEYDRTVSEDDPLNPESNYAQNKIDGEKIVSKSNGISLRYFNVYGPGQSREYAGVISIFIKQALKNKDLIIFGDGNQERDFVYIDDITDANIAAMNYSGIEKVFNIASGKSVNLKNLASKIIELCASRSKIVYKKPRNGDIIYSCADVSKAKSELNWSAKIELETGLKKTIESFK